MKITKSDLTMYRLTFSRITGHDAEGRDIRARPKEIGAVWAREAGKAGGIVSFDFIPVELTQRQGVMFLVPVGSPGEASSDIQSPALLSGGAIFLSLVSVSLAGRGARWGEAETPCRDCACRRVCGNRVDTTAQRSSIRHRRKG